MGRSNPGLKSSCPGRWVRGGKKQIDTQETWTISGLENASAKTRPANFQFLHSEKNVLIVCNMLGNEKTTTTLVLKLSLEEHDCNGR